MCKLDPIQEIVNGQYEENEANIQDQGSSANVSNPTKKKRRKHKGSCDSSSSGSSAADGPMSHQRLLMKAQEVKANNALLKNGKKGSGKWNVNSSNGKFGNSIGRSTIQSKRVDSRKTSNESGYNGIEVMNDSVAPPMMIDNSAVIFNNKTKNKKSKITRNLINNPLQSDIDKSELNEMGSKSEESKGGRDYRESEGESAGEGESYGSSCT